jgi:putative tricarboxylic transport membrane protein
MTDPASGDRAEGFVGRLASSVHKVDLVVAAFLLAICGFLFWDTTKFAEIPRGLAQNVPPERFPQLLLIVIAAMALFLPFEHVQKRLQGVDLDKERSARIKPITFVTALALFGVVLVTPWLGTLPAMVIACALIPVLWGERRYWLVAIYAIAMPFAVGLLFVDGLGVNFLPGIVGHVFR